MPELPEIMNLAEQIRATFSGKRFAAVDVVQPKCLNMEPEAFAEALPGARWLNCRAQGKWLVNELDRGWLLINLGMGGELLYHDSPTLAPPKYRMLFSFADGTALSVSFWWFGYVHWVETLAAHKMLGRVGRNALDLGQAAFSTLCQGRRGGVKNFLLRQQPIAGIGNMYIHDILFLAKLHPLRAMDTLSVQEQMALLNGMQRVLGASLAKGGSFWEQDLFGRHGGYTKADMFIAYREGEPCPICGSLIRKIETGSNSGYICPHCQPS